jgi:energy-converting hydrogenase Eha subunit E
LVVVSSLNKELSKIVLRYVLRGFDHVECVLIVLSTTDNLSTLICIRTVFET